MAALHVVTVIEAAPMDLRTQKMTDRQSVVATGAPVAPAGPWKFMVIARGAYFGMADAGAINPPQAFTVVTDQGTCVGSAKRRIVIGEVGPIDSDTPQFTPKASGVVLEGCPPSPQTYERYALEGGFPDARKQNPVWSSDAKDIASAQGAVKALGTSANEQLQSLVVARISGPDTLFVGSTLKGQKVPRPDETYAQWDIARIFIKGALAHQENHIGKPMIIQIGTRWLVGLSDAKANQQKFYEAGASWQSVAFTPFLR